MNFQGIDKQIHVISRFAHLFCINHGSGTPEVDRLMHHENSLDGNSLGGVYAPHENPLQPSLQRLSTMMYRLISIVCGTMHGSYYFKKC